MNCARKPVKCNNLKPQKNTSKKTVFREKVLKSNRTEWSRNYKRAVPVYSPHASVLTRCLDPCRRWSQLPVILFYTEVGDRPSDCCVVALTGVTWLLGRSESTAVAADRPPLWITRLLSVPSKLSRLHPPADVRSLMMEFGQRLIFYAHPYLQVSAGIVNVYLEVKQPGMAAPSAGCLWELQRAATSQRSNRLLSILLILNGTFLLVFSGNMR